MASSVRRDVSPATPLRTGSISRDAVSDGLRNRFFADAQNDNERVLRMTTKGCSEWQRKGAQNDNERVLRMTEYRGQDSVPEQDRVPEQDSVPEQLRHMVFPMSQNPYAAGASLYNKRGAGCMPAPAEVLYLF